MSGNNRHLDGVVGIALSLALGAGGAAWAQEQAPEAQAEVSAIEEIIVTARKREEPLQKTPVAITAFSGSDLEALQVDDVSQAAEFAPNLVFDSGAPVSGSSATASIFIRGIGSSEFSLGTEQGVGLYVDGVYLARSVGGVLDLVDVESLQVLRGPQGTLFGRNTVGGAILVQSTRPADELGGSIRFTTGNDTRADLKASVDIPLGDNLRSRFSFLRTLRDGYVENLDGGEDLGSDNAFTSRGVLEWTPSEQARFSLAADYTRERESAAPHVLLALPEGLQPMMACPGDVNSPGSGFPFLPGTANCDASEMVPSGMFRNFFNDPRPQSEWGTPTSYFEIYSNRRSGINCGNSDVSRGDGVLDDCIDQDYILGPYRTYGGYSTRRQVFEDQIAQPYENASDLDVRGIALTAEFGLGSATLKSITAFRDLEGYWPRNADHSAAPGLETKNEFEQEQFTQELQLLGTAFGDSLDWILGLYYLDEEGEHLDDVGFPQFIFRSGGIFTIETWAAFAQGAWRMGERWELTLGARYTSEEKTYDPDDNQVIKAALSTALTPPDPIFQNAGESDTDFAARVAMREAEFARRRMAISGDTAAGAFPLIPVQFQPALVSNNTPNLDITETTPYASLSFDVAENFLTYISYSRGYKSGGYEQRVAPPPAPAPRFLPEFADVYEFGFKSTIFGGSMRFNGAVFYTDYKDMQISLTDGSAPTISNAGDATIQGFELEAAWLPSPALRIDAALGYLDAGYDSVHPRAIASGVRLDNDLPNVADLNFSLSASYEFGLVNGGALTPRVDFSYRSEVANDAANTPELKQDAVNLLNASLAYTSPGERWSLVVAGRNLLDEEYLVTGLADPIVGYVEGIYARPSQWSLSLKVNF